MTFAKCAVNFRCNARFCIDEIVSRGRCLSRDFPGSICPTRPWSSRRTFANFAKPFCTTRQALSCTHCPFAISTRRALNSNVAARCPNIKSLRNWSSLITIEAFTKLMDLSTATRQALIPTVERIVIKLLLTSKPPWWMSDESWSRAGPGSNRWPRCTYYAATNWSALKIFPEKREIISMLVYRSRRVSFTSTQTSPFVYNKWLFVGFTYQLISWTATLSSRLALSLFIFAFGAPFS